jgi:hypothetical protein
MQKRGDAIRAYDDDIENPSAEKQNSGEQNV